MQLEFLGTGAGSPGKFRNVTSTALRLLDERNEVWLFDVGEGTQHQILRTTLKPRKIAKIFITHLHGDHIFGLPGLLSSRSFQGGDEPLTIYGPVGVRDFVQTALRVSGTHLSYPLKFHEITKAETVFEDTTFKVSCEPLDHRIACFGYRVEEADHPGELQADRLKALNIPSGPVYGQLKAGKTVTLPDGRTINGQDYIAAPQKGRTVTILGDTRRTPHAVSLAQDADALVHESTFGKDEGKLAHNYYHSTSTQAAQVAQQAGVKQLLLTHISARYTGKLSKELQKQAQKVFSHSKVVRDFDVIDIPLPEKG
ncbi:MULTISPECIES: ribonuclease Z [Lactiplantibacillus]|jgi:ribonuclease Z|uniref:Ribonuclease Z n=2 Tax=Lactiplantibacillus plantarum TaxID=1590 RepID=A0A837NLW1_LACPN|nr:MULTISPECIES: ribonuclease Z [Lactiplantibacillus]EYR70968.1 ribonuclease Z [Lactiplantibacillus plantarum WHE 92]AGE39633.1 Ribonuclease Z [Lactiplantibacillus plantarum ZJ316]AGL64445.2 Ribonuclease Z [Lactiplantibacillus plantarum subsp. plantarum P-8]AMO29861.1 ribonuclease Z [Lactiplantibacillus plantarum]ANI94679.1 ribonuclease Z [Lactiplantibacillus plantarum]